MIAADNRPRLRLNAHTHHLPRLAPTVAQRVAADVAHLHVGNVNKRHPAHQQAEQKQIAGHRKSSVIPQIQPRKLHHHIAADVPLEKSEYAVTSLKLNEMPKTN